MAKVAVVTGGVSGIGAATAEILRAAGWRVVVTGLTEAEVAAAGGEAATLDVTDAAAVAAFFAGFERLDGLVNAAGTVGRATLGRDEFDPAVFAHTVDVNLTGTMRCAVAALPALRAAGGSVVNIASVLGYTANPIAPGYSASKAGVVNLTRALGAAWAADGVRVNAVAPGYVETAMTAAVRQQPDYEARVIGRTAMGRWGKPEEIARLICWLLSEEASFVTGSTHLADGGYLAT